MLSAKSSSAGFLVVTLTVGLLAAYAMPMRGQDRDTRPEGKEVPAGFAEDWSHRHVVFSNPGTADEAMRKGKYDEWFRIVNNPRYESQEGRRRLREKRAHEFQPINSGALKTDWSMSLGAGGTVGAGQYPAKFSFTTNYASCGDWVAFNTGVTGSSSQPNIEAYNNIYKTTCSGTVPGVYWSYFTGTGKALTSVVVSIDGNKVAFIENPTSGAAVLRILQWAAGEGTPTLPKTPTHSYTNTIVTNPANKAWNTTNCPTGSSCMISVAFQNGNQDLISAPFYDYANDTLWVGDASGKLHEFVGVFMGTPYEVTANWPINVSTKALSSPTFDSGTSQNIFVGDAGGILYSYKALLTLPTLQMKSSQLTYASTTTGIVDAPIVDSTTEQVYVSVGQDAELTTSTDLCGYTAATGSGCSGEFQFPAGNAINNGSGACSASSATTWVGTNCGHEAVFGIGAYPIQYDGAFDNAYFNGTGTSGYLWVCGPSNAHGTAPSPRLSAIDFGFNAGSVAPAGDVIGFTTTVTAISTLTSNTVVGSGGPSCSPVTEFYNTGNASMITSTSATITGTGSPTTITVGSNANITIGNYIQINSEDMLVTGKSGLTSLTVARGQIGTAEAAHNTIGTALTIPAVDYVYFSVTNLGIASSAISNCVGGACLYSYPVGTASGSAATFSAAPANGEAEPGGTSGIVIDNSTTAAGESQIYFTPLSNGTCVGNGSVGNGTTVGCAIQTSQSAP